MTGTAGTEHHAAAAPAGTAVVFRVGIGEFRVEAAPHRLLAYGLGSCVAVFLYDVRVRLGGLAHVMLPGGAGSRRGTEQPGAFADLAIDLMVGELARRGAAPAGLAAKLFGGANMFPMIDTGGRPPIGERNVVAVREQLGRLAIPIVADHTGGEFGRTVEVDLASGVATVRAWNRPTLRV